MRPLTAFPLFLLACTAPAQSLGTFGSGCGARSARLSGHGSPTAGNAVEIGLIRGAPSAPHVVILGLSNTRWAGGGLPFAIPAGLGFASGCALRVAPNLVVPLPVAADGRGTFTVPIATSMVGARFYAQVAGAPAREASYATRGVSVSVGARASAAVIGRLTRRVGGSDIANARVTLFTPALGAFAEVRSDASGRYLFPATPVGTYRLGIAARGFEYVETEIAFGSRGATRDFGLDAERHPGRWTIAGNTLPHFLDATDIAFLLPDGQIFYCHDTDDPLVFDPVSGRKWEPKGSGQEQGCTNGTLLEDGSVIEIGGQDGSSPARFRWAVRWIKTWSRTAGWQRLPDLLNPPGRWYPGLARLANGDLLIMGGGQRPDARRTDTCEIFNQKTRRTRWTGRMGQAVEYPPAALLYNGTVLRTWGRPQTFDPRTDRWTDTARFAAPNRGWPGHSDHSLVVLTDQSAVIVGVNQSAGANAAMVERYDPSTRRWSARSSPALKRMQTEITYLPDGQILVAGGDRQSRRSSEPDRFGIVRRTDLYDPVADRWRRVGDMQQFREYHAVTILVPDGRVLTTGGTKIKFKSGYRLSPDIEAFEPPYLFRGVRPVIASLNDVAPRRGATVSFDVTPATRVTSVVLMGTGAHTHWVEGGVPRRLELTVSQIASRVTAALPRDANELPVGHYLLFAMIDDIPSVGRIVRVRE